MTGKPCLILWSDDLLSKWGFNCGEHPGDLLDYWDDVDPVDYNAFEWSDVLRILVPRHLLPVVAEHHQIQVADFVDDNPVRAERVDGLEVWGCEEERLPRLAPESVTVSYDEVMVAVREVLNR